MWRGDRENLIAPLLDIDLLWWIETTLEIQESRELFVNRERGRIEQYHFNNTQVMQFYIGSHSMPHNQKSDCIMMGKRKIASTLSHEYLMPECLPSIKIMGECESNFSHSRKKVLQHYGDDEMIMVCIEWSAIGI